MYFVKGRLNYVWKGGGFGKPFLFPFSHNIGLNKTMALVLQKYQKSQCMRPLKIREFLPHRIFYCRK